MTTAPKKRQRRTFLASGWCSHPFTASTDDPHARCSGFNTANPDKEYQACPCACHLGEIYECGGCGRDIAEAPNLIPLFGLTEDDPDYDPDDNMVYTHLDSKGWATGEECAT